MDGNRRWARLASLTPQAGHRAGARHMQTVLGWCEDEGLQHVTIFVVSSLNLQRRDAAEVANLIELLETVIASSVSGSDWQLHVAGDLALLPGTTEAALREAMRSSYGRPRHLTLAIGYDWQEEVAHAARSAVAEAGSWEAALARLDEGAIAGGLRGGPSKDIDLVIRTSGEQRLSGFFPWETAGAELYFADVLWPDFSRADLLAGLEHYAAARDRR